MHMLHYTIYYACTGNFYPLAALKILRYKGLRGYGRIGYGRFITYPREVTLIELVLQADRYIKILGVVITFFAFN